jgi:hypothetical protein
MDMNKLGSQISCFWKFIGVILIMVLVYFVLMGYGLFVNYIFYPSYDIRSGCPHNFEMKQYPGSTGYYCVNDNKTVMDAMPCYVNPGGRSRVWYVFFIGYNVGTSNDDIIMYHCGCCECDIINNITLNRNI